MWAFLRARQLAGYNFRRQHSIGAYSSTLSVVELDGGQHAEQTHYEDKRTHFLESTGYRVVRYWDHELLLDPQLVLDDALGFSLTASPLTSVLSQ